VDIYSSANGAQFTKISSITDSSMMGGLCCGTLYELPSKVGNLAPGTLLWSGSVGQNSTTQPMQLEVYASSDQGHTWTYLSNCATGATIGTTAGGLWEPQFTVASDGALACFYSDEQQAGHSQLIHQVRSYDGIHWQDSTFTIASAIQDDRPGMAVATRRQHGHGSGHQRDGFRLGYLGCNSHWHRHHQRRQLHLNARGASPNASATGLFTLTLQ
jgi:hypothetical protein